MLREPHIAPLTDYVDDLRSCRGDESIPYFDPTEAGIGATILVLLEAPGRKAAHGSGFVSADNDDPTAENMWNFYRQAEIDRSRDIVAWNVCPWYVGTPTKIRSVTRRDMKEAGPHVERLLGLLDDLRVVILLGLKAQKAWGHLERATSAIAGRDIQVIKSWHPSPRGLARYPHRAEEILENLRRAGRHVQQDK